MTDQQIGAAGSGAIAEHAGPGHGECSPRMAANARNDDAEHSHDAAEAAGRMCKGQEADAEGTAPALEPLEVAVLQRLARQPGGGLSDSMWTGDERCALGGLMLREPRLVDIPPIPRSRWARWFITAEGRAALEASNGTR